MPFYITPSRTVGATQGALVARNLQPASADVARSLATRTNTLIARSTRTLASCCDYHSGEGITTAETLWRFSGPSTRPYLQRLIARWVLAPAYSATGVATATLYTRKSGDGSYYAQAPVTVAGSTDAGPPYAPSKLVSVAQVITQLNAAGDLADIDWDGYITVANGMQVIAFSLHEAPLETISKTQAVIPAYAAPGMPIRTDPGADMWTTLTALWADGPVLASWTAANGVSCASETAVNATGSSAAASYDGPGSRHYALSWEKLGVGTVPVSLWIVASGATSQLSWELKETTAAGVTTSLGTGTFTPGATAAIQRTAITTWNPPDAACNYQLFVSVDKSAYPIVVWGWGVTVTG